MPTISVGITNGLNDGQTLVFNSGAPNQYLTHLYAYFGVFTKGKEWPGFRFLTVNIPQGATISSATLSMTKNNPNVGSPNIKVYANNVDNAPAWGTTNRIKNISKTSHSAVFDVINAISSTDVTSIVQEIVNRVGWVANNNMAFAAFPQNALSSNGMWYGFFYEQSPAKAASLSVTYTSGGTGSLFSRPSLDGLSIAGPKQFNRLEAL